MMLEKMKLKKNNIGMKKYYYHQYENPVGILSHLSNRDDHDVNQIFAVYLPVCIFNDNARCTIFRVIYLVWSPNFTPW